MNKNGHKGRDKKLKGFQSLNSGSLPCYGGVIRTPLAAQDHLADGRTALGFQTIVYQAISRELIAENCPFVIALIEGFDFCK